MMVHRDGPTGTLILDRVCGKLGRVKLASGTRDPVEFAAIDGLVVRLRRERRWDLLSLLQQHHITPIELYDAVHRGQTGLLPAPEEIRPLEPAVRRWLAASDLNVRTRADYRDWLAFPGTPAVAALPELLAAARVAAIATGKRQMFNNRLTAARSFVRAFLGPESRLWKALPLELEVVHREGNPQEPGQIRALAQRFRFPAELWAICLTGMRQGEYWGSWDVLSDRVQVNGTKTFAAKRVVPLVFRPAKPAIGYSQFYHDLVEASDKALNVHDLRKTALSWWEDAGIPEWRIRMYAGHSRKRRQSRDLAVIYQKPRDLTRLLVEDAARVRTWLGDPPELALRMVAG